MADTATKSKPVATLRLTFRLAIGDKEVPPPHQLATPMKGATKDDFLQLRARLDEAADKGFGSGVVEIQGLRFRDNKREDGRVTAEMEVVTVEGRGLTVEQFAGGLTWFADNAPALFEPYFRKVTHDPDLHVSVTETRVEQPERKSLDSSPSLTVGEQTAARWISGGVLVLVVLFVLAVLSIFPFGIVPLPVAAVI